MNYRSPLNLALMLVGMPDTATGAQLDELAGLTGVKRTSMPHPIKDQVLVRQDAPSADHRFDGGVIYAPDEKAHDPKELGRATVLEVGPTVREPDIKPGTVVRFKRRGMTALNPDSRERLSTHTPAWEHLLMLREADLIGIEEL